eukprot:TRINITY_DN41_c2_g1_i1.p1 TRINITY_DN41_c2_g1~~TRINITY_DN41_c2_g1_i1.p1  ORF type:complete len:648 (-),score=289.30 TRINITY_DN41_c2_g1_i1:181-2124(-)
MGKEQKKGKKGGATSFISRSQAVRKLQVPLKLFRKLCILKGVFPREPKRVKSKAKDKTYYMTKDIGFIAHDPLLEKFRDLRAWKIKLKKAQSKKEENRIKSLKINKPQYFLDHIVKERYPTFIDALRDVDDALNLLHLFALMTPNKYVTERQVNNAKRLCCEFQSYVIATHSLRKTFISIKGIYFQAEIFEQKVTWLVPHQFGITDPKDVDLKVMLTFLEFYETLISFVNFKLYHSINVLYPPKKRNSTFKLGVDLGSIILKQITDKSEAKQNNNNKIKKNKNIKHQKEKQQTFEERVISLNEKLSEVLAGENQKTEQESQTLSTEIENEPTPQILDGEFIKNDETELRQVFADVNEQWKTAEIAEQEKEKAKLLFSDLKFYLSRETPKEILFFLIKCFGGNVCWDNFACTNPTHPSITHHVTDRPINAQIENAQKTYQIKLLQRKIFGRDYIQPQWIFDCINAGILLPVEEYAPNAKLPPHLSPFVDDQKEGYTPERRKYIDNLLRITQQPNQSISTSTSKDEKKSNDSENEEDEAAELERLYEKEREAELSGVTYSNFNSNKKPNNNNNNKNNNNKQKQNQENKFKEMMIKSGKQKRLYIHLKGQESKIKRKISKLENKKKLFASNKEQPFNPPRSKQSKQSNCK